jgi:hypothetical protein
VDIVFVLDSLERKLHPRQRVGVRWVLWCLVNAAQMFFQFWRYCYGCGTFKGCTCPKDDPYAFTPMDARTAASVAWVVWRPSWDARPRVTKPSVPKIGIMRTRAALLARLVELERGAETGPWKVEHGAAFSGDNWLLASFGSDSDLNVYLTTDRVHASECSGEGALADAQFCAEIRNLMPRIIAALRSSVAFEELEASASRREVA